MSSPYNWCHKKNYFHQQGSLFTKGHLKLYSSIKMCHRVRININCFLILTFESIVLTWPLTLPQDKYLLLLSRKLLWVLKYWKSNCIFPPFFMIPSGWQTCHLCIASVDLAFLREETCLCFSTGGTVCRWRPLRMAHLLDFGGATLCLPLGLPVWEEIAVQPLTGSGTLCHLLRNKATNVKFLS